VRARCVSMSESDLVEPKVKSSQVRSRDLVEPHRTLLVQPACEATHTQHVDTYDASRPRNARGGQKGQARHVIVTAMCVLPALRVRFALGSPNLPSALPIAPTDVHTTKRFIASSRGNPASTMPSTICAGRWREEGGGWRCVDVAWALRGRWPRYTCAHTPSPALPAPAQRKDISVSGTLACRAEAMTPASVTQPVPWMSSLKQRNLWRYLHRGGRGANAESEREVRAEAATAPCGRSGRARAGRGWCGGAFRGWA
jgi:hypothetical protein